MNCREAQNQIFAERDGALAESERASLVSHLATCGECRQLREDLATALTHWKTAAQNVVVPDVEREWHAVRRKIRGGVAAGEVRLTPQRANWFTWLTVPLASVGALALALFLSFSGGKPGEAGAVAPEAQTARAESVEVSGRNASTVVTVDGKSGWIIVLASDAAPKRG